MDLWSPHPSFYLLDSSELFGLRGGSHLFFPALKIEVAEEVWYDMKQVSI